MPWVLIELWPHGHNQKRMVAFVLSLFSLMLAPKASVEGM